MEEENNMTVKHGMRELMGKKTGLLLIVALTIKSSINEKITKMYIYICMYVYIYMRIYIYIYHAMAL